MQVSTVQELQELQLRGNIDTTKLFGVIDMAESGLALSFTLQSQNHQYKLFLQIKEPIPKNVFFHESISFGPNIYR